MKLSLGMAVYDSFVETWNTIQSLRLFHILPDGLDAEILVIDNHPGSHAESRRLSNFCASWGSSTIRYVAMPGPTGTTQPRNRVFEEAKGEIVLCMDNHVHLAAGSLKRLVEWFDANPGSNDLVTGPILSDEVRLMATHWDAIWRDEMWGVWAQAWECRCPGYWARLGDQGLPSQFSTCTLESDAGNPHATVSFRSLATGQLVSKCERCHKSLPTGIPWSAHEPKLEALGYYRLGSSPDDAPFEIPGMGLGLFGCRRDYWLGFNRDCRGFGGEEMCVHEKYRQAGRKTLCLPFLRWLHLFRDPLAPTKYPGTLEDKAANYVLWFRELGLDLAPVYEHLVKHGRLREAAWDRICDDPAAGRGVKLASPSISTGVPVPIETDTKPTTLAGHRRRIPPLNDFIATCKTVTEMNHRRGNDGGRAEPLAGETDFLFIEFTPKHSDVLTDLLDTCHGSVKSFIAVDGTEAPGLFETVTRWCREHPQWFVVLFRPVAPGIAVIQRNANYAPPIGFGPGTELKKLLASMGIVPDPNCACLARMEMMDRWGVEGCREHRQTIIDWLKEGQERWGWTKLIADVFKRIRSGWPTTTPAPFDESYSWLWELMRSNPFDPIGSLVDAAIRRADKESVSA